MPRFIAPLIIVLLAMTGCSATITAPGGSSNSSATSASADGAQGDTFKVGQQIGIDDTVLVVNSAKKWTSPNDFQKPEAGKVYLIVNLTIENKGTEKVSYNAFDYKVEDADGVQNNSAFVVDVPKEIKSGSLAPNGKLTGNLVFEVPKNMKSLKLIIEPSFWSNQQVKVILT